MNRETINPAPFPESDSLPVDLTTRLITADRVLRNGITPNHPCIQKTIGKWLYGVMYGVITPTPRSLMVYLHQLARQVILNNRHVLFIDSLNVFNPEWILTPTQLSAIEKKYDWFPQGLFYSRPFQYHQFHKILAEQIPDFLMRHRKTRLVLVGDPLRMFLDPKEHQHDNNYPREQIHKLIQALRVLRQASFHYQVATIVLLNQKYTVLSATEKHKRTPLRKKFPLESLFPVLLEWNHEKRGTFIQVLKHFDPIPKQKCSEGQLTHDPFQARLEHYYE